MNAIENAAIMAKQIERIHWCKPSALIFILSALHAFSYSLPEGLQRGKGEESNSASFPQWRDASLDPRGLLAYAFLCLRFLRCHELNKLLQLVLLECFEGFA